MTGEQTETVLRMDVATKILVWVVCGAAGVGLGLVLPWLLQNLSTWPIPYLDVLKFLGSFDAPIMVIGRPVVLGAIGLVIAFFLTYHSAILTIGDERIVVREGDDERVIERRQIAGVYRHGQKVRVESPEGRVLFDDDVEGGRKAIAAAFLRHGYPWEGSEGAAQATTA